MGTDTDMKTFGHFLHHKVFDGKIPWDFRVYWPFDNDEYELQVAVQWEQGGKWEDHRYKIHLRPI